MGLFDTAFGKDGTAVQLKVGPCLMNDYYEGESVRGEISDGIYYGYEGVVVIEGGIVLSVTEEPPQVLPALPSYNKWGGAYDPAADALDASNPIAQALQAYRKAGR
jgi:hypothetical protein